MKNVSIAAAALALAVTGLGSSKARAELHFHTTVPVNFLEATYLPHHFVFGLKDVTCRPGESFTFSSSEPEKVKMAYTTALSSLLSGNPMYVVIDSSDVCSVRFIGLVKKE